MLCLILGWLSLSPAFLSSLSAQVNPAALPDLKILTGGRVHAVVVQSDGSLILGGEFTSVSGASRSNLVRLLANGAVDSAWNVPVNGPVYSLIQNGSNLVVGGAFNRIGESSISNLAKVNLATKQIETGFAPQFNGAVRALALVGSDLYVGGDFSIVGEEPKGRLARMDLTTQTVDPSWNPGADGTIYSLAVTSDGLVVAGGFTRIANVDQSHLAKLSFSAPGELLSWNPGVNGVVRAVVSANNEVFFGGDFQSPLPYLGKVDAAGVLDSGWSEAPDGPVLAMNVVGDFVYVGGRFNFLGRTAAQGAAKLALKKKGGQSALENWNPRLDKPALVFAAGSNSVLVGGEFRFVGHSNALGLSRLLVKDATFMTNFLSRVEMPGKVQAIAKSGEELFLGGDFYSVNGQACFNFARLDAAGNLNSYRPRFNGEIKAFLQASTQLFVAGSFSRVNNSDRAGVAALALNGTDSAALLSFDPGLAFSKMDPTQGAHALYLETNHLYVGGYFTKSASGQVFSNLIRAPWSGSGSLDTGWRPNPNNAVFALTGNSSHVFAGGIFTALNAITRSGLAKISKSAGAQVDLNWQPEPTGPVYSLLPHADDLFVGGSFIRVGQADRTNLARISTTGTATAIADWNLPVDGPVFALSTFGNSLNLGGSFSKVGAESRVNLARITLSGDQVDSWNPGTDGPVRSLLQEGRDLYVAGAYGTVGGIQRTAFSFLPVADGPVLQLENKLVTVFRADGDEPEVTHFKLTGITGGTLYFKDTSEPVALNQFITFEKGIIGLKFVSNNDPVERTVTFVSSLNATEGGAGNLATTLTVEGAPPPGPFFKFSTSALEVIETNGFIKIPIIRTGTAGGTVNFLTESGTATEGEDFTPKFATVDFTSSESLKEIEVAIPDDLLAEANETFLVRLSSPSAGQLVSPSTLVVTIIDNEAVGSTEPFLTRQLPTLLSTADYSGVLILDIEPAGVNGQWRLVGEANWRDSGLAATGLLTANYEIEFRPINGFLQPPNLVVPVTSGQETRFSAFYTSSTNVTQGHLTVTILPETVATNADLNLRGQWRRQGTTEWLDSGQTVSNLTAGIHVVEFKNVPGRATPQNLNPQVFGDQVNSVSGIYLVSTVSDGAGPELLTFEEANTQEPYLFNGQIQTSLGFGSGVVVKERVVLTAAHVLFDDVNLEFMPTVRWFFQRYQDRLEPVSLVARGFYVFQGYSDQRQMDDSPGISGPESQNLDAAALYFMEPAGRGGFGGYLSADGQANPWLVSNREKRLVGYPLYGIPNENHGKLHATPAVTDSFAHLYNGVFASTALKTFPGNSGGPLYARADDGHFYPAAIFLGGAAQTVVRAIDSQVVDLINRAEISGNDGGNSVSGGVALFSSGLTTSTFTPGFLSVTLAPASALQAGAGWRLAGNNSAYITNATTTLSLVQGNYEVEFAPLEEFEEPSVRTIQVSANQTALVEGEYVFVGLPPVIVEQPSGLDLTQGTEFTLDVVATGTEPFLYQWFFKGELISGATNQTFAVQNAPTNASGGYHVVVRNNAGNAVSDVATVLIKPANNAPAGRAQELSTSEDTPLAITLTATDVDGDSLTYSLSASPAHGVLTGTPPQLTYTPHAHYYGEDAFQFQVSDGSLSSVVATVLIQVNSVNDGPQVSNISNQSTSEDTAIENIDFVIGDLDDSANDLILTILSSNPTLIRPEDVLLGGISSNRTLAITPRQDQSGTAAITVKVSDGGGLSASDVFNVVVQAVNDLPTAHSQAKVTVGQNTSKNILLTGNDVEGSSLVFSVVSQPEHGILEGTAPNLVYTPALDYQGVDSFTFKVNDGQGDSNPARVSIEVNPITGEAPSISDVGNQTTQEDVPLTNIVYTVSDTGTAAGNLVVSVVSSDTNLFPHESISIEASGAQRKLRFIPAANRSGSATILVTVEDNEQATATDSFTITVEPVNDAPVGDPQTVNLAEDETIVITLTGSDVEGDGLIFDLLSSPGNGDLEETGTNHVFVYVPDENYHGLDRFRFQVVDEHGAFSGNVYVDVNIASRPDAPLISALEDRNTNEDLAVGPIPFAVSDVETAATNLSVTATSSNPTLLPLSNIILVGEGTNRTVTLVPAANAFGSSTVTLKVTDKEGGTETRSFLFTVKPVDDVPVATSQKVVVSEDSALVLTLAGSDIENSPLTFTVTQMPQRGTLQGTAPQLTYRPAVDFSGSDIIKFRVNDGLNDSLEGVIQIQVNPLNDPPFIGSLEDLRLIKNSSGEVVVEVGDVETPAGLLTLLVSSSNPSVLSAQNIEVDGSGSSRRLTLVPEVDATGQTFVTLSVSDGSDLTSSTFLLSVEEFSPVSAVYQGLFYPESEVSPLNSGFMTLTLSEDGTYIGKLQMGSKLTSFHGEFDDVGVSTITIVRALGYTPLELVLDYNQGPLEILGILGDETFQARVRLVRTKTGTKTSPVTETGSYTFVIPGIADMENIPGGTGFGTVKVESSGRVRLLGTLGDATKIKETGQMVESNESPVFVPLDQGQGMLLGWLRFDPSQEETDVSGQLAWIKAPRTTPALYANGFSRLTTLAGSRYVPPVDDAQIFSWSEGLVILSSGNLAENLQGNFLLESDDKFQVVPHPSKLILQLKTSSGLFSGTFMHPVTGKKTSLQGAVLQKSNQGLGLFPSGVVTGNVQLISK